MSDTKTGNKPKKEEVVKHKFFAFLRATSLKDGKAHRDHIHLGKYYGRNVLLLGWSSRPFKEAIKAVHEVCPMVSEKTIGTILSKSMVKLFEQFNVRDDADPEANAGMVP